MTTATTEPNIVTAGDLITWQRTLTDYPANVWTLNYVFINKNYKYSATGTASGTDHAVSISSSTTANWAPGEYRWQSYVTSGSDRITIGEGNLTVKPNFATATTLDTRSIVKRTLDAIEAVIEGRASQDQQEYTIGNRSLTRTPIADLIVLRDKYKMEYLKELQAEKLKNGLSSNNKIIVRF